MEERQITKELLKQLLQREMLPINDGLISSLKGPKKIRAELICDLLEYVEGRIELFQTREDGTDPHEW
jgi:hypothetical protein